MLIRVFCSRKRQRNETSRAELAAAIKRLQSDDVTGLFYLAGGNQLGNNGEATVDSSHPTDIVRLLQNGGFV